MLTQELKDKINSINTGECLEYEIPDGEFRDLLLSYHDDVNKYLRIYWAREHINPYFSYKICVITRKYCLHITISEKIDIYPESTYSIYKSHNKISPDLLCLLDDILSGSESDIKPRPRIFGDDVYEGCTYIDDVQFNDDKYSLKKYMKIGEIIRYYNSN
jgi:hypothetical protein